MDWFDWAKEHLAKWKQHQKATDEYWDRFTPRAQVVLAMAHKEAKQMNHDCVGTAHLLLGLLCLKDGVAVNVLKNLGLNLEVTRAEVGKQLGVDATKRVLEYVPLTPRSKKVLGIATKEAKALGHTYIGTEHLLLGLLAEKEGPAWQVFKTANIDSEKTRREILEEITPIIYPPVD